MKVEETKEDKELREAIICLEMRKIMTLVNEINKLIKKEKEDENEK